ncbi:hypothetical protein MBANPS3_006673 [Mucor bainieri]
MANIKSLSTEVLLKIFALLEVTSQVAECRLVCRSWSTVAEMVLLQNVKLYEDDSTRELLAVLLRTPSKAKYIKRIDIHFKKKVEPWCREALRLAMTPNLESLEGFIDCDAYPLFFHDVLDIAENSPIKFDKVKKLDILYKYARDDMLDCMGRVFWYEEHAAKSLPALKGLSTLTLSTSHVDSYPEHLESFLNYMPLIKSLSVITVFALCMQDSFDFFPRYQDMVIQQLDSLEVLKLEMPQCSPKLIRYFIHKYPRLHEIELQIHMELDDAPHRLLVLENLEDTLAALKPIPRKKAWLNFHDTRTRAERILAALRKKQMTIEEHIETIAVKRIENKDYEVCYVRADIKSLQWTEE